MLPVKNFMPFRGFYIQLLCGLLLIFNTLNNHIYAQEQDSLRITEILSKTDSTAPDSLSEKIDKRAERKRKFTENHSPRTAILFGIIPGGGQIYNRRYWKLPIVYGGLGGFGYWAYVSRREFLCYRNAYKAVIDDDPTTVNTCDPTLSDDQLKLLRDKSLQNYEYAMVGLFAFYALTLVDALVDAHLMKFDISDDLSMQLRPSLQFNAFAPQAVAPSWSGGLSLQFCFRHNSKPIKPLF